MDPVNRVQQFLLDNVGHMTHAGKPSFDPINQHWSVPICCRTERGDVVIGDVVVDQEGQIVYAPSREQMLAALARRTVQAS